MGCISSKPRLENKEIEKILTDAFVEFIESNCIKGPDKCVHIQKLEAAFAFYLQENNIKVTNWWLPTVIEVVHYYLEPMILLHLFSISPGFTGLVIDGRVVQLDTRYVLGLDVVRFMKA